VGLPVISRFSLRYALFLRVSDVVIVILALALSSLMRINLGIGLIGSDEAFLTPPALFIVASILWLLAFQLVGVYSPLYTAWLWQELQRVILGHGLACLLFFGVLYITLRDYSRLQAFYLIGLVLLGVIAHRSAVRVFHRLTGKHAARTCKVLIVGTDANAQRIGETVTVYQWTGLQLLGYLRHHPDDSVNEELAGQVLGDASQLPTLVAEHAANEVIIALKTPDYAYVNCVIESLQNCVTNIRLAPDYSDLAYFHVSIENFGGIPLVGLREAVLSPAQRVIKRVFDIALASVSLLFGWPVLLGIAIAIRLDSSGPVIFRQERIGQHGRLFNMLKFRSMVTNAEELQDKSSVDHKHADDPRVTEVGRFIRRTSLDELPQLFNILRGDMSFVGPRPEMPWLVDKYELWQRKRFEVPQGLTGWWQINGRSDKPMYLHTEDDLFYIRNYSLWLDFQIILRTVVSLITGRGAY
jgi:exopolysaccharide biosynthesis polyprenyl glycosylphosphotransferase